MPRTARLDIPESSKQHVLSQTGLSSRGQDGSLSNDQSKQTSRQTSLASIDRGKLRFGLSLGWQLARFEFVDESLFPEAQAVAPTIRKNIADLLSSGSFPNPIAQLGYRDMIYAVRTYYGTSDIDKHSAILVGVAAFRASLVGASKDETCNLGMRQLSLSAIQDIDPRTLPRKLEFFEKLIQKKPGNIAELIGFIDSFYRVKSVCCRAPPNKQINADANFAGAPFAPVI